jgi:hypothetical protein
VFPNYFQHALAVGNKLGSDRRVEKPEEIRSRVLETLEYIPPERLGPQTIANLLRSVTTRRVRAVREIRSRVVGSALAANRKYLNGRVRCLPSGRSRLHQSNPSKHPK